MGNRTDKKTNQHQNEKPQTEKKRTVIGTPYDDAFRTLTTDCPRLLISVINEIFDKNYSGNEEVVFYPNEHFVNEPDGSHQKKVTDSFFSVVDIMTERYLLECQSTDDNTMIIRIVEYQLQTALDTGEIAENKIILNLSNAAVLFLRSSDNTPDSWTVEIRTPGGDVSYEIPTMKMSVYALEDIFDKKLYFLLPFYIFNHEDWIKVGEEDADKRIQLLTELTKLSDTLEALMEKREITTYEFYTIMEMAKIVADALIGNREKIKEGVDQIMGGKVLEYRAKDILREGIAEGRVEGRADQKTEDARAMYDDGLEPERIARILKLELADVEIMLGLRRMA